MGRHDSGYHAVMEIARGGMGTVSVVLRREGSFERLYALKRLRDSYQDDSSVRQMFLAEARIAGLIRHPNVVSVLDVGTDADGPFLVMDYVEGVTVSALLTRLRDIGQLVPLSLALRVVADAARGLTAAHDTHTSTGEPLVVIHRDVSPQNLLVGFDGVVRVADFGVAKVLGHLAQTADGVLKGKLGYMSPEQLRFEDLDPRSDLFGLGVVLFELLSGQRLYGGQGVEAARRILNEAPPDIGEHRHDLPVDLVMLTFQLLAKQADQRPSTAAEVATRLDAIRSQLDDDLNLQEYLGALFEKERAEQRTRLQEAVQATLRQQTPRPRRWPWVAAAAVLCAGTLIAFAWTRPKPAERVQDAVAPVVAEADAAVHTEPTVEPEPPVRSETPVPAMRARPRMTPRVRQTANVPTMEDVQTMETTGMRELPRDDIWSEFP